MTHDRLDTLHSAAAAAPAPSRSQAPRDPLEGAPVVVSIEHTKPGSPLDEHLRREQTRALLDLLADHVARQQKRNPKAARRC